MAELGTTAPGAQTGWVRRITRYRYNNVPADVGGRYYYIHDAGDYWTPGWAPSPTYPD